MKTEEITAKLKDKRVGIAGCGGLGSNCAIALARVGVGSLVVVDFDVVSESNLNRQYFFLDQVGLNKAHALKTNIARINPAIVVTAYPLRVTSGNLSGLFTGCDVVVEAFDRAEEKQMLIEAMLVLFPLVPVVSGLGMAGWGNNEIIHYRRIDNLHICGDEVSEIGPGMPPLGPRVGIVANMQANVTLEILLGGGSLLMKM